MSELNNIRLTPTPVVPIIIDGDIDVKTAAAIVLRNAGTATVNLWGGMYTLDSKETLSFNITEIGGWLDLLNIPVTFDTTTGAVKKLQVVLLKASQTIC